MPSFNLSLLLSYLLSSPLLPLQRGRLRDRKATATYIATLASWKIPKSRRREAIRKDRDRESALSSVGHVNCPAWPRPRTPTLGGWAGKWWGTMWTQMQKAMVGRTPRRALVEMATLLEKQL